MRPWLLRLAAVALLAGLLGAMTLQRASACSCAYLTEAESFEEADVVFAGRAGSWSWLEYPDEVVVAFEVSRVWKGQDYAVRYVATASHGAMCGVSFEDGEEYIVYAYTDERGVVWANRCSWTRPLKSDTEALLDGLAEGRPPEPGTVAPGPREVPPPSVGDTGTGTVLERCAQDRRGVGLLAAVAVLLAGAGFVATRRRARQT